MEETTESTLTACAATPRDKRNQWRINLWMAAWMAPWLALTALVNFEVLERGPLASLLGLGTALLGVGAFLAYRRFLREADELRRKVELDALAIAFGVGIVGGLSYWLLGQTGAFEEVDLLAVVTVMIFTHAISVFMGLRRFQ